MITRNHIFKFINYPRRSNDSEEVNEMRYATLAANELDDHRFTRFYKCRIDGRILVGNHLRCRIDLI